jgi:hypothetical protein
MMPSQNELSALSAPAESRDAEARHVESGASNLPGAQRDRGPSAQPWGLSFVFFLLGFALLVVLAKLNLSRLTVDVLRGVAAGLCVAAFVTARRAQRAAR